MQNKNGEEDFAAVDGAINSIGSLGIAITPVYNYFMPYRIRTSELIGIEKYVVLLSWCMNQ